MRRRCVSFVAVVATTACMFDSTTTQPRPNWHQDIAPLVHEHCVGCHREGGVAPFDLHEYASAQMWAEALREAVLTRTMPPWGPQDSDTCEVAHAWVGDARLSDAQLDAIARWVDAGAPEGDPALAAALPDPPADALSDADAVFELPSAITLPEQVDSFVCVSIDPGLAQDVWITGLELLPDNEAVVHHVLIMLDPSGESAALAGPDGSYPCNNLQLGLMLGSYFPGAGPTRMPEGVGVPFPVGARVVLNFHYHPSDAGGDVDRSSVALRWRESPPTHDALLSTVGNATSAAEGLLPGPNDPPGEVAFRIPPGVARHTETMQLSVPPGLPADTRLFMLGPHMHSVGTDIRLSVTRAGHTQCILDNPRWDPDWQSAYVIAGDIEQLPTVAAGDVWTLTCTYDNSLDNPQVVEALAGYGLDTPISVGMGSAALDEMCMFVYGLALPR